MKRKKQVKDGGGAEWEEKIGEVSGNRKTFPARALFLRVLVLSAPSNSCWRLLIFISEQYYNITAHFLPQPIYICVQLTWCFFFSRFPPCMSLPPFPFYAGIPVSPFFAFVIPVSCLRCGSLEIDM